MDITEDDATDSQLNSENHFRSAPLHQGQGEKPKNDLFEHRGEDQYQEHSQKNTSLNGRGERGPMLIQQVG